MSTPDFHIHVRVNLAALQGVTLRKLQRLIDILDLTKLGIRRVEEAEYPPDNAFYSIHPSSNTRFTLPQAQEESEKWFILNSLRDAVEAISLFLEDARRICAVHRLAKKGLISGQEWHDLNRDSLAFHRLGLPRKFKELETEYGVVSDFSAHVLSHNAARNCIVHRDGIVTRLDLNVGDRLTVTWSDTRVEVTSPDGSETRIIREPTTVEGGWTVRLVMGPTSKTFALGESVKLTYDELSGILTSHLHCVNSLTRSVQAYAEGLGFTFPTPVQPPDSDDKQ